MFKFSAHEGFPWGLGNPRDGQSYCAWGCPPPNNKGQKFKALYGML